MKPTTPIVPTLCVGMPPATLPRRAPQNAARIKILSFIVAALIALTLAGCGKTETAPPAATPATAAKAEAKAERKLLYYRNPMGLADTSPAPKKDSMGMDYIAVYEDEGTDENASAGGIKISTEKIQKLGVKTEIAAMRQISRSVRAVGTLQADEQKLHTIAPKFEGWIEQLHVSTTGASVARGQALMTVYSPELVSAQQEYALAKKSLADIQTGDTETRAATERLAEASLSRLRNWGIGKDQITSHTTDTVGRIMGAARYPVESAALSATSPAADNATLIRPTMTLRSPAAGVVLEKTAVAGMRFMPGEVLYKIADLSSLWVLAEVFEQDLAAVRVGQSVNININAYPEKTFQGKVAFVYPTVNPQTRTTQIRIVLANPGGLLKPAMYANVELVAADKNQAAVVSIPISAVIDSGTRRIVLIQQGAGRFEPREVKLGTRGDHYVEVVEGVRDGEQVVVTANFLIDAESNLKAAISGFGHSAHDATPATGGGNAQPATDKAGGTTKPSTPAKPTTPAANPHAGH